MQPFSRIVLSAVLCLCSVVTVAQPTQGKKGQLSVRYEQTLDQRDAQIRAQLKQSTELTEAISFLQTSFHYREDLQLIFGGEDGPLYDAEQNEILMPYFFLAESHTRFKQDRYIETGVSAEQAALDAFIHTLFHEFAHAAVRMYDLPIIGKEEDAADALAAVLLIEYFEDGQEITISAADLFNLEDLEIDEFQESDYWAEHSLEAQRYYNALCFVYGSAPERYQSFIDKEYFSQDRGETCIDEYFNTSRGWLSLLAPHMIQPNGIDLE